MSTGWREIDFHGCCSLLKINLASLCMCKNNRQIWRHNCSVSRLRDTTGRLWWRHNARLGKTVLGNNGEMSDLWLFSGGLPSYPTASDSFDSRRCNMTHSIIRIWWNARTEQCWVSTNPRKIIQNRRFKNGPATYWFTYMMTSSNGNIFRVTWHLCGEFSGQRWIPHTKASDAELWCFLWSASE